MMEKMVLKRVKDIVEMVDLSKYNEGKGGCK